MLDPKIKTFITVVECGSFNKAGEKLFLSGVSVIKQINSLEQRLGFDLLIRTNRGVSLTKAGMSFYSDSLKLASQSREMILRAQNIAGTMPDTIRVGTSLMRPCSALMDRWDQVYDGTQPFHIEIVPFEDKPSVISEITENLGKSIDCIIGPYGASMYTNKCNVLHLGWYKCMISLPKTHNLSNKKILTWSDLEGESVLLVREGLSDEIDKLRQDILLNHPGIQIVSYKHIYDIAAFNQCLSNNMLMESPEFWADIHPSIITLPMEWDHKVPYGVLYSSEPSESVQNFINSLKA